MAQGLPTGTVTFLFTDVEGSTGLWERHPEQMRTALAEHDALIESLAERHGGVVVRPRGEGDSRFCVFARATDAVAAAAVIQRALQEQPWPEETPLRVRMAVHTGEADLRAGDYYGSAVNRAARLRGIAHGGQTVLSMATEELVRDSLPPGVSLKDLGEHRLTGLSRPERVFQLAGLGTVEAFPPLRSVDAHLNNLPLHLEPLVGREAELAALAPLIVQHRLVTLTGPGGTGKTRLAIQAAADALEVHPDGVWFVDLSAIRDPRLVPQAIAASVSMLALREEADRSLLDVLVDALAMRRVLLILDNCEHLLDPSAASTDRLLRHCPGVRVLATSRAPLRVYGEHEFAVPPLALPADISPAAVTSPAVALFIARARAVRPEFAPSHDDVRCIAEICRRLDGLPLAIELAAARTRLFSPQALLARLLGTYGQTPLRLLTGGSQTLPLRQQTLRGAIEWSYQLLTPQEQYVFRRLALCDGGCGYEAAEAIASSPDGPDVLDALDSLVEKHLIRQVTQPDGEPRFTLLEMIREYGLEQLAAAGERDAAAEMHAAYYVALAERAAPLLWRAEQRATLDALAREHANLRQALTWLADAQRATDGLRLAGALWRYWDLSGALGEGREWLRRLEPLPPRAAAGAREYRAARTGGLLAAGSLALAQDDYAAGTAFFEEALSEAKALSDSGGVAAARDGLGEILRYQGDFDAALRHHQAALALWRELGDQARIAHSLYCQGVVVRYIGNLADTRALFEESLMLRRALGDRQGAAWSAHQLGVCAETEGDLDAARSFFEEGLTARRSVGDRLGVAYSLTRLAGLAARRGEYPTAAAMLGESIPLAFEFGDRWQVAFALVPLAQVFLAAGDAAGALRLVSAGDALLSAIGARPDAASGIAREDVLTRARSALGGAASRAKTIWEEGQRLELDEIAGLARACARRSAQAREAPRPAPADGLTRREREVAVLVAEGLTNRQIAERLVISERTADTHVQNILGKLGFATRVQIAGWMVRQAAA